MEDRKTVSCLRDHKSAGERPPGQEGVPVGQGD